MDTSLIEALLGLNKAFMINGYNSDFTIELADKDFDRFVTDFETHYQRLVSYPDLHAKVTLRDIKTIKIAGPGSYFLVKRAST